MILYLRYRYHLNIEGLEKSKYKRIISSKFGKVYVKNINETKKYEWILIGDELEQVNNPLYFLKTLKKHLKDKGYYRRNSQF